MLTTRRILIINCLLLITFLHLYSCKKDFKDSSWDTDWTLPILNGKLGVEQMLADSLIENVNGNLIFTLRQNLVSLNPNDLITVPDTTVVNEFHFPLDLNLNPGFMFFNETNKTAFGLNGSEITNTVLENGKLKFEIESSLTVQTFVDFTMTCAKKNGIVLNFTIPIPAAVNGVYGVATKEVDLSGYDLDMKGTNGKSVNTVYYNIKAKTDPNGVPTVFYTTDVFRLKTSYTNVKPYYMKGYFSSDLYKFGPEKATIPFFTKIKSGLIDFNSVKATINVKSNIGADMSVKLKQVSSSNTRLNHLVNLSSSLIDNTIALDRATYLGNGINSVKSVNWNYVLNQGNSNIKPFLENMPDELIYSLNVNMNPYGNSSAGNDFVFMQNPFSAYMDLEIPLKLKVADLIFQDSVKSFFYNIENKEKIHAARVKITAYNSLPLGMEIQLFAVHADGSLSQDLMHNKILQAGLSNNLPAAKRVVRSDLTADLGKMQTQEFLNAEKFILKAKVNSQSQQQVEISPEDFINYSISLQIINKNKLGGN